MASPKVWAEVWRRPGHAVFARQIADLEVLTASADAPTNGVGTGRVTLPVDYARIDEIIKPARPTVSAAVSSLVRYFCEEQDEPIFEWIPAEVSGRESKEDIDILVKGAGIDVLLGYARVEAWDWTGVQDEQSNFPDWVWGGRNILGELTSVYDPAVLNFWVDADGGTYTLSVSVDGGAFQTTSAIAYNADAATVQAALIALSNVTDMTVSGSGTQTDQFRVVAVLPEGEYTFTKNAGSLNGPWEVTILGSTGGTWTATIDGATTSALSWNLAQGSLQTAINALATVDACTVSKHVLAFPGDTLYRIYFTTPDTISTFTVADSLTPAAATVAVVHAAGTVTFNLISIGGILPQGWTPSFNPVTNLPHGFLDPFRITTFTSPDPAAPACDTTGMGIAFKGAGGDFPGVQKIVTVKPGGTYYASIWAYAQGAAETYRFVIRDLYENGIAADPGFTTGTTISSNTWTQFFIPTITIPDDVERVIYRFASVNAAAPNPLTFIACMELREGMPPTTWGDIWTQLWLDATTDHAGDGRIVWEIGTSGIPYLTLDFDAVNDSAGNPWTHPEVRITLKRGRNYLYVRGEDAKMGYEGRIVPDDWQAGTYKFQLYNEGTMLVDQTAITAGPTIQGGRDVARRDLRRFLPPATNIMAEAAERNIARRQDDDAVAALGLIESYHPDEDLGTLEEAGAVADTFVDQNLSLAQSLSYVLLPVQDDPLPFVDYHAGDLIYVVDPPEVPREARRIKKMGIAWDKNKVEFPIQLEAETFVGVGAIYEGVNVLLKEAKVIRTQPPEPTDILNYFTDPCCPSCPAILVGSVAVMRPTFTFLAWTVDNDPDGIVEVDAGGSITFPAPGLYTVQFKLGMTWNVTTTGWAVWRIRSSGGEDGISNSGIVVLAAATSTFINMEVEANIFTYVYNQSSSGGWTGGWELATEQSAGLVNATSGVLEIADLMVVRHIDGCARPPSST